MRMSNFKNYLINIYEELVLLKRRVVKPERYIRKMFYRRVDYPLNLDNPKTYNEKLQWLKLYWHHPMLPTLVDKYSVKDYVIKEIGEQFVIPTLGVWDNVNDIDWESLPDQFVLKCTHDSGGIIICQDKSKIDKKAVQRKLKKCLSRNFYYSCFEWPYKDVKPRIIAEPFVYDSRNGDLKDYKFFCFNGEVKAMFIATERNKKDVEVKFDFFDADFNHLPFSQGHPNSLDVIDKPLCFEEMKSLASKLSHDFPHVRVDFYEVDGKILFGEMTFFHYAGWVKFNPHEWDNIFGNWLNLPQVKIL